MPSFADVAAPTMDGLEAALAEVVRFMERHALPYAEDVRMARNEVADGDAHGARRYLALNRALLDVYFSPVNGNARSESEGERLTSQWSELHRHAFTLCDSLLRASR
jgi:hypothetical protein